ncbi:Cupin superfamily protein [Lentzea albidocapillata subsp. violacea]|uniref:Cupin superfamily protein n=1 Tax=Lentzea albidocapillata subsp. violacea TaxID=128104 RepID=A0A1G9GHJ1_9PSEU|nr:cupin domain-containing protein [Lentzea albidocapillata]SDL00151.1 Cupin superfamily protein [Lentzea albidocapillata subsp. violacea]
MEHRLIEMIEKALGWSGAAPLGRGFARGSFDDPELYRRLLTPQRLLDAAMRRSLAPPQLRCFQNGEELRPNQFLTSSVTRRGQSLPMANMDTLSRLMRTGCTLVVDAMDTFDPTMEAACRALQWWSHELVQVNTYLTTADAAGFGLHWDDHDVIVVQLAGEKSWEVRGASREAPMYRDAAQNSNPSEEVVWSGTMRPGDVMHIPRGYWHTATRNDRDDKGFSLHVTFGFVKRTGVDWMAWLADKTRTDLLFRQDLDRFGTKEEQGLQHNALYAAMLRHVESLNLPTYLAAREAEQPPCRYVHTGGLFGPVTDIVCVSPFPPDIEVDANEVTVTSVGKRLRLNLRAEAAARLLLSGYPVSLSRVSELTGIDAAPLAEIFMKEGLCAELTDALHSGFTGLVPAASCLSEL